MAELMFNMEDEFGLELTSDPTQIATFGDVVHFIDGLIAAKSAGSAAPEDESYAGAHVSVSSAIGAQLVP